MACGTRARSSEIIENKSERRQLQQAVLDAQNNERDAKNELAEARPILISIHMPAADRTLKGYAFFCFSGKIQ